MVCTVVGGYILKMYDVYQGGAGDKVNFSIAKVIFYGEIKYPPPPINTNLTNSLQKKIKVHKKNKNKKNEKIFA
jgi:hypothetical protein